jgi:uncharacterized protein (TIGR00730 family)
MKRVCVFCGSSKGNSAAFLLAARVLGEVLAARDIELVFGGSHVGLMGVVADAVLANGGKVTGVLPRFMDDRELAHPNLTKLHVVETMHERKQLMAELSEGFIALPGGFGTLEEIFEAITWQQLGLHAHPCGLLNVNGYFESLVEFLRGTVAGGFVQPTQFDKLVVAATPVELLDGFDRFQPDKSVKWIPSKLI